MPNEDYYLIGIDGGASKTRGVLFNQNGETLSKVVNQPTHLIYNDNFINERIYNIIKDLTDNAGISIDMIDALGLGLAGAKNLNGRDKLFKYLDSICLANKSVILSDAESAMEICCPISPSFLINVGTGMVCLGKDKDGNIFRTGGKGHGENGDIGSGYWLGKKLIKHLLLNNTILMHDNELLELQNILLALNDSENLIEGLEKMSDKENQITATASLAKDICNSAKNGNTIALNFIQEATTGIAEEIIELTRKMQYSKESIFFSGNGSLIRNDIFRSSLDDALRFDFNKIVWTFSSISAAYGAGIVASRLIGLDIELKKIVNGDPLASA